MELGVAPPFPLERSEDRDQHSVLCEVGTKNRAFHGP